MCCEEKREIKYGGRGGGKEHQMRGLEERGVEKIIEGTKIDNIYLFIRRLK